MQCLRSVCKKWDTKGSHAIKITKQTFESSPMVFGQLVHKLGEFIHNKGNIRPSHLKMLEATNHLIVHGGIYRCSTIISSQGSTHGKRFGDKFEAKHVMFAQNINDIILLR